jgi:hypothetical protein
MVVLGGMALLMLNTSALGVFLARRTVLVTLRLARANAITKSIHYQVSFPDAGHITLSGMRKDPAGSGAWVVDPAKVQTIALPALSQVSAASLSSRMEFNSHGLVANATAMTQISLTNSSGTTKSLRVWPSGQINEM